MDTCAKAPRTVDPVTGEDRGYQFCSFARSDFDGCGLDAKYFEPKVPEASQ